MCSGASVHLWGAGVCTEKHPWGCRWVFCKVRTSDRRACLIPPDALESTDQGRLGLVWPPVTWAVAAGVVCIPTERGDCSHSLAQETQEGNDLGKAQAPWGGGMFYSRFTDEKTELKAGPSPRAAALGWGRPCSRRDTGLLRWSLLPVGRDQQ